MNAKAIIFVCFLVGVGVVLYITHPGGKLSPSGPSGDTTQAGATEITMVYSTEKKDWITSALGGFQKEHPDIKVNLVTPGFTRTNLNGYAGTASLEEGSQEVVRVAMLGPDGPTGTFTRWKNQTIPW